MPRTSSTLDPYAPMPASDTEPETISGEVLDPPGTPNPLVPADGNWTRPAMRRFLESCPTRMVHVPRDPADKPGQVTYHRVIYQGFNWDIQKGRSVEVPEPIASIVDELDKPFRTAQAQNRAQYLMDIGAGDGPEIQVDRGASV